MTTSLFSEIDGKSGENLATAILATILEMSPPAAHKFCEMLSTKYNRQISAAELKTDLEQWTDDDGEKGRIDLLITTANFAIGIECKILHYLAWNQPKKYRSYVASKGPQYLLLVLVPKSGETRAESTLKKQELGSDAYVITWEELINALQKAAASDESKFLIEHLRRFINDYVGALDSFKSDYSAIFGAGNDRGKRIGFLHALKRLFHVPEQTPTLRTNAGRWTGCTFVKHVDGIEAWYGFVSTTLLPKTAAPPLVDWKFVIGLSSGILKDSKLKLDSPFSMCSEIEGWKDNYWRTWIITPHENTFADKWEWQSMLAPIHALIDEAIAAIPPGPSHISRDIPKLPPLA